MGADSGRSVLGAQFDPNKVDIYLGAEKVAENGMGLLFDEERAGRN